MDVLQQVAAGFDYRVLDEVSCRELMLLSARGVAPSCPTCGASFSAEQNRRLFAGCEIVCDCGVSSSPRTGTLLEGSTLSYSQLMMMFALLKFDLPASEIAERCGCTAATVRNWRHRLGGRQ